MKKTDQAYLRHMLDGIDRVTGYLAGISLEAFRATPVLQAAAARELEIIGEAANKVSADLRRDHPDVPWGEMIATRNHLIHAYFDVDVTLVWSTVQADLPSLRGLVLRIIEVETGQIALPGKEA